jgi:quercetin dioxygenase-like cupin family protein
MTVKSVELFKKGLLLKDGIKYADGSIVSKTIVEKKTATITLFAFDEAQNLSEHTAPFDALALIVDGECEVVINKKSNILRSGQMIIMPANIPHAVNAKKKFKMLLIMIKDIQT